MKQITAVIAIIILILFACAGCGDTLDEPTPVPTPKIPTAFVVTILDNVLIEAWGATQTEIREACRILKDMNYQVDEGDMLDYSLVGAGLVEGDVTTASVVATLMGMIDPDAHNVVLGEINGTHLTARDRDRVVRYCGEKLRGDTPDEPTLVLTPQIPTSIVVAVMDNILMDPNGQNATQTEIKEACRVLKGMNYQVDEDDVVDQSMIAAGLVDGDMQVGLVVVTMMGMINPDAYNAVLGALSGIHLTEADQDKVVRYCGKKFQ